MKDLLESEYQIIHQICHPYYLLLLCTSVGCIFSRNCEDHAIIISAFYCSTTEACCSIQTFVILRNSDHDQMYLRFFFEHVLSFCQNSNYAHKGIYHFSYFLDKIFIHLVQPWVFLRIFFSFFHLQIC